MEIDIKYVPDKIKGKRYYQFTAIDSTTGWRHLAVYDDKSTHHALRLLKELMKTASFKIEAVKTDNDSCFANRYNGYYRSDLPFPRKHCFDRLCDKSGITHYLIDPGKPC